MTAPLIPDAAVTAAVPTAVASGPKLGSMHKMAMHAIHDHAVVCHPAGSHHIPGWGWAGGGDMTLVVQAVLADLHTLRLLSVDLSGRFHVDGDPVVLTGAGEIVLGRLDGKP